MKHYKDLKFYQKILSWVHLFSVLFSFAILLSFGFLLYFPPHKLTFPLELIIVPIIAIIFIIFEERIYN